MTTRIAKIFLCAAIVLAGCRVKKRPLTPIFEEIVLDFQLWITDHADDLQFELDKNPAWVHDISDIDEQSWKSEYFENYRWSDDDRVAAYANPSSGHITFITTHAIWPLIEENYVENREKFFACESGGEEWILQTTNSFRILAHENGHNIFVKPHEDVYTLGDAAQLIREKIIFEWKEGCNL